jgi:LmbE family N-acetylglucosaminyl deacetylase
LTVVILSPHTDDAIFSLGQHLTTLDSDVPLVIASVFAGIPEDDAGHRKHKRLRAEHELACEIIGASEWNGEYLDDVYQPRPSVTEVRDWIVKAVTELDATVVYIPLGIHHPDHVAVTVAATRTPQIAPTIRLYADLPYHTDYPGLAAVRLAQAEETLGPLKPLTLTGDRDWKLDAVHAYQSQIDMSVIGRVMVDEHVWELA